MAEGTRSRSQPILASNGQTEAEPSAASTEHAIISFLARAQCRDLHKDTGHGYRSVRLVAQAVGVDKATARAALERLAADGLVRREECSNALLWRSVIPLPWEPGGALAVKRAHEQELWASRPLTLIVQSYRVGRDGTQSRDVKAYPAELRAQAEAHVSRENHESERRQNDDQWNNYHLNDGYVPPPRYRLVSLLETTTAKDLTVGTTGVSDKGPGTENNKDQRP